MQSIFYTNICHTIICPLLHVWEKQSRYNSIVYINNCAHRRSDTAQTRGRHLCLAGWSCPDLSSSPVTDTHTVRAAAAPTTGPFYPLGPWQPQRHQMTSIDDDLSPEKQWDDSVLTWSRKSQRHSRVSLTDVQEKWTFFSSLTTALWCHLSYVMGTAEKGY